MNEVFESGVRIKIILDTRRAKKDNVYPVKYRLTYQARQIYINAGFDLSEKDWEELPKSKKTDLVETRKSILSGFDNIRNDVKELCKNFEYSHESIIMLHKKGRLKLISETFADKIKDLKSLGQPGTAGIYNNAKTYFEKYDSKLTFSEITPRWLKEFEGSAIDSGLSRSTLSIYLRCLRVLFNDAIQARIIKETMYPFTRNKRDKNHFRIKSGSGTKVALTPKQLRQIAEYNAPTKAIGISRDLFLLSFLLAGMNFKDMLLLKWSDIRGSEIIYVREKTKNTEGDPVKIRIPYIPITRNLIEKLGDPDSKFILPYMIPHPSPADVRRITYNILRQVNRHLQFIGKELKIKGISSMVARHSFAQVLNESNTPLSFISESLGHKSLSTTKNYLKEFNQKGRKGYYKKIESLWN